MCEILLIIAISKKIAAMMKEKGRTGGGYVALFVLLWFGGEVLGFLIGLAVTGGPNANHGGDNFEFMAYIMALVGAAIGGGTGYAIAASMPALEQPDRGRGYNDYRDDDDDYDYERERRRRRREREEDARAEDHRPSRRHDEDADKIEEDRPRRRRDRDDDNFEEDRPRR